MQGAAQALEQRLGYKFKEPRLPLAALTHTSYINEVLESGGEPPEDNQRLEFLGDAVIDLLIGEELFRRFPQAREGELTQWRAQLVSTEALASVASQLQLGELMLLGKGEANQGGQHTAANLAAAFEAVVAAVYLDSGLAAVGEVFLPLFQAAIERVTAARGPQDARSRLQELAQARFGITPQYRTVEEHGPDHARVFTVQVTVGEHVTAEGTAHSKRAAAQNAAEKALAQLSLPQIAER
jgi:ribonuclease-3